MTDFDEICQTDAYWPPTADFKISNFLKIQHGGGRILKITKIADSCHSENR